jgi:hypothetical protein
MSSSECVLYYIVRVLHIHYLYTCLQEGYTYWDQEYVYVQLACMHVSLGRRKHVYK